MIAPLVLMAACLPLDSGHDRVSVGDLAAAVPGLASLPGDTALGYAPAPGTRRVFSAAELARLAARHNISLDAVHDVCVEYPLEEVKAERLLPAMRQALAIPEARLEVVEHSRYPTPRGEIEFPRAALVAPPLSQPQAAVLWRGYVRYAGNRRFAVWARVRIVVRAERVIAAQPLPAGRAIDASVLRVETYEGFPLRQKAAATLAQVAGRAPRRSIPAGAPIIPELLDDPHEVSRGDTVAVEVSAGAARVEMQAHAESNGRRGQTIAVRNPSSGKRFAARVTGPGKVVVSK